MNNRHGKDRIYYPSEKASPPKRANSNSGIVGDSLQALAVSSSSTVRRNISLPSMDHGLDKQPCGTPMQQGNRKTGNLVPLSVSGFGQGLSPRQLCMILPYHIVVDSHFNVLQFGIKLSFLKPANKNKASSKYRSEQSSSENYIGKYFDLISAHVESPLGGSLALVGHEDIDHGGGSTTAAVAGLEWRRLRAGPDSCYELQLKDRFIRRIEHQEQQTQAQTQGQLAPSCLSSPMSVQSMGSASSAGSVSSAGVSRYSSIRSDFAGTGAAATSQSAAISALRAESTDSAQLSSVPRNASAASAASSLPCTYATSDTVTAVRLIGELRMLGGDDEEKASSASLLTALSGVEGAVGVPYAILLLRPAPPDRSAPSQACDPAGTDPAADPHKAGSELYRNTSDSNPSGVTTSGSGTIWSTGSVSGACMGGGSVGGDCPSFSGSSPTSISSASAPVPLLGQFSRANSSTSTCSITSTVTSTPVGHAILQQQLQQRVLALEEENMRLLEQLQLQARRQEQSSALPKDAVTMLGNVAHDLKTPLAAFLGGLDLIEDAVQDSEARVRAAAATAAATTSTAINSTPKSSVRNTAGDGAGGPTGGATKQALRKVQKSLQFVVSETDTVRGITNFMKMTINRCIDYTKSTQGLKLVPKNETFRLHEDGLRLPIHCMRAVQSKLPIRLHAHAAQHHCGHGQGSSQGPSGQSQSTLVCSHIISDRLWLQENLLCLLSNAVKYSFDGSIDVRLSLLPEAFTVSEAQVQLEKGTTAGAGAGDEWTVEALRAAGFPAVTYPVTATAAGNDTRSRNDGDKAVGGSSSDVQAAPVPVLTARKLAAIHAQALPRARQQRQEQAAAEARMPLMRRHTMRSGSYIGHNHTQQQPQDVGDISCPSAGAGAGMPIDSRTSCPAAISASPSASLGTKHRGGPRTPQRLAPIDSCSPGAKSPGQSPGQGEEQRFSPDGRVGAAPLLSSHPTSQEGSPCKVSSLTSMLSDLGLESGGAATGSSTNGSSNATHSNLSSGSGTPSAPVYLPSSAAALASALAPVVTGPPHACGSNSISSCSTSSSSGFTTRSSVSGGFGSSSGRGLSEGIALRPDLLSSHSLSFSAASSSSALGGVGVGGGFLLSASASGSFCANANANASATSSAVSRRPSGLNLSGKVFGRELMLKIGEDQELEAKSDSSSGDGGGGDRAPTRSPVDDRLETALVPPLLVVEVEDSGIGLQEETMDQLFTPFKQAQRLAGGTGLGLYSLSKRLDALGGFYGVEGRRDGKQGSVFWFAIPYRADSNAAADAARAAAKAAARDAARAAAKKQQLQQQQQHQQQQQMSSVLVSQRGLVPDGGGGGQLVDKAPLAAVKEGIAEEEDQGAATSPAKPAAKHITVRTQGDSASHTSPLSPLPLAPAQARMRATQSSTSHTGSSSGNDSTSSFHSASASASTSLSMSGSASPAVAAARRPRSGVPPINTSAAVAAANISPQRCGRSGASRASGGVDKAIYLSPRPPSAMNSPTSNSAKGSRGFFRSSAAGASVGSFHSSSNNSSSSDGLSACSAGSLFSAAGIPLSPRVRSSCAEGAAATISPKQDQQIRAMMRQGAGIAVTSPAATSGIARVSSSSSMISTGSVGTPRSNLAQNILRADSSMSGGGGSQSARRLCGVRPLRLLVVDDSEPIMKITCAVLRRQGHHVDQASNGLQALERIYALQQLQEQQGLQQQQRSHTAAGARPGAGTVPDVRDERQSPILGKGGVGTGLVVVRGYDVVLMDLQMPVLDGLEAIVRLRATEMERETGRLIGGEVVPTGAVKPTGQEEVSVSTDSGEETGKVAATAGAASAETTVSVAALSASTAIEYRRQLVVGLSANGDNDTAQAAFDAGADDFMVKPFNLLQFYEIYSAATATNTATATAAASASKDC